MDSPAAPVDHARRARMDSPAAPGWIHPSRPSITPVAPGWIHPSRPDGFTRRARMDSPAAPVDPRSTHLRRLLPRGVANASCRSPALDAPPRSRSLRSLRPSPPGRRGSAAGVAPRAFVALTRPRRPARAPIVSAAARSPRGGGDWPSLAIRPSLLRAPHGSFRRRRVRHCVNQAHPPSTQPQNTGSPNTYPSQVAASFAPPNSQPTQ